MSTYLTLKDFEGRKFNPYWTRFEILLEVAEVAYQKLVDAKIIEDDRNNNNNNYGVDEDHEDEDEDEAEEDDDPRVTKEKVGKPEVPKLMSSIAKSNVNDDDDDDDDSDDYAKVEPESEEEEKHNETQKLKNSATDKSSRKADNNYNNNVKKSAVKNMTNEDEDEDDDYDYEDEDEDDDDTYEECDIDEKSSKRQKSKSCPNTNGSSSNNNNNNEKTSAFKNMTNEEWIKITKSKQKQKLWKRNKISSSRAPPPPPSSLPPPPLPEEYEREIVNRINVTRENKITRLIHKPLFSTDVSARHGRVSIPCSQIESFEFLKESEMTHIRQGKSIKVPLIHKPRRIDGVGVNEEGALIETDVELAEWDLHYRTKQNVSSQYVLRSGWNKIVANDELKCGDVIQIWAFRNGDDRLCMVLVVVERARDGASSSRSKNVIKIQDQDESNDHA